MQFYNEGLPTKRKLITKFLHFVFESISMTSIIINGRK